MTGATIDGSLRQIQDRQQILDTFARYAFGMDRGQRSLFESVWTANAEWRCDEIGLDLRGRTAIMEGYDRKYAGAAVLPAVGGNLRLSGNHIFDFRGDIAYVTSEMASLRYTGDSVSTYAIGFYEDQLQRVGAGWQLQRRLMIVTPINRPLSQENS